MVENDHKRITDLIFVTKQISAQCKISCDSLTSEVFSPPSRLHRDANNGRITDTSPTVLRSDFFHRKEQLKTKWKPFKKIRIVNSCRPPVKAFGPFAHSSSETASIQYYLHVVPACCLVTTARHSLDLLMRSLMRSELLEPEK